MEGEEAENLLNDVQLYLRSKGFRLTELALLEERNRRATTFDPFVSLTRPDDYPAAIYKGYEKLRAWANGSLDEYKHEFISVLYPLFVQCSTDLVARGHTDGARVFFSAFVEDHEQMHSEDLHEMKRIFLASPLEYSYELLLEYLHKTQAHVMLAMINEKIIFEVSVGQPSLLPLGKQTMTEVVKTGSASALVAISALNLIAAKTEECGNGGFPFARDLISTLPYMYLPFGLVGVAFGVGAVNNQRLLAGCLLGQFIYLIIVGGLRLLACRRINVWLVGGMVLNYIILVITLWSFVCAYPKRVRSAVVSAYHCYVKRIGSACAWAYHCCTRQRRTPAVQAAENLEHDLEANAGIPSVAMSGDQVNRAAGRDDVIGRTRLKDQ